MSDEQKNERKPDRFTELMFGKFPTPKNEHQRPSGEPTPNQVPEMDIGKIMNQIDGIMSSINQLKPMIKKITPLMDLFKK